MNGRKERNIYLTIFAIIGVICAIASIAFAVMKFCKKECEYDCDEFDFDDCDCDDDDCDCCDENGCGYTAEEE